MLELDTGIGANMGHGKYDRDYEWDGSTLVLDPGVFTFDEPHVYMGQDPPGYAGALNCLYRSDLQDRYCRAPDKLLALDHGDAPAIVKEKCDTIGVDAGYCCPQYAMPRNWRVDFLPLGQEDAMPYDELLTADADLYAADARLVAGRLQMEAQPVLEEFTSDAQVIYDELSKQFVITASDVSIAAQQAAAQVSPVATVAAEGTREKIRKHPLLALGIGIAAGAVVARMVSRR